MTVTQGFRYALNPTVRQKSLLAKAAGTARYAFNRGWNLCKRLLNARRPVPHAAERHRLWNAEEWQRSWVYGASKCRGQEALRDLDRAFANFWRGRRDGRRVGFPRFGLQHGRRDAFWLTGGIKVHSRSVSLPRIGCVRTKEPTKLCGRIPSATVRRESERWYVSLAAEVERDDPQPVDGPVVGMDLGLKSFAVLAAGILESPRPLAKAPRRLCHRQRLHSRKQRGSRHRRQSAAGLARLHRCIRCPRVDFLHQASTGLTKTKAVIVVEDLSLRGMIRNRHLSRSIADAGWSACSACGHVKAGIPLGEQVFQCQACGVVIDRDLNAARKLASLVAGGSPETPNACRAADLGQGNGLVNRLQCSRNLQVGNGPR